MATFMPLAHLGKDSGCSRWMLALSGRLFGLAGHQTSPDRLTRGSERAVHGRCHSSWHPGNSRGRQIGF
jgi:hypothetical protein